VIPLIPSTLQILFFKGVYEVIIYSFQSTAFGNKPSETSLQTERKRQPSSLPAETAVLAASAAIKPLPMTTVLPGGLSDSMKSKVGTDPCTPYKTKPEFCRTVNRVKRSS
jgi:hypothetical protein